MNCPRVLAYLFNVAVLAIGISLVAWIVVKSIEVPRSRATAAMTGILVSGLLPWAIALVIPIPSPASPWLKILLWIWLIERAANMLLEGLLSWFAPKYFGWMRTPDDSEWAAIAPLIHCDRNLVRITGKTTPPSVFGVIRPILLLPHTLFVEGAENELRWAMRALSVLRTQQKLWWQVILRTNRIVFGWNPFFRRLTKEWLEAFEMVADREIARTREEREAYREFLISIDNRATNGAANPPAGPCKRFQRRLAALSAPEET